LQRKPDCGIKRPVDKWTFVNWLFVNETGGVQNEILWTNDGSGRTSRHPQTFQKIRAHEQLGIDLEKNYNFAHLPIDFVK
jgi:hypothetical protein